MSMAKHIKSDDVLVSLLNSSESDSPLVSAILWNNMSNYNSHSLIQFQLGKLIL